MLRICENCIHNEVCKEWAVTSGIPFVSVNTCENFMTADVVPRAELEHILSDLKKEIHDKAVYPNVNGVEPYIPVARVDALIQRYIDMVKEGK